MLQPSVYLLCMIASLTCLFLLARGYLRTRVKFLFWMALCFVGYAVNNFFLFLDLVLFPDVNLMMARNAATLFALAMLFYGLIGRRIKETFMQLAIYGAFAASHLIAAAFFLRFWTKTKAPMLALFSIAFLLLGLSYGLLCFTNFSLVEPSGVYLVRLASFVLIIVGIVLTNVRQPRR